MRHYYSERNKHLNKQEAETMEQYNERMSNFENKIANQEWNKVVAYEEMEQIIAEEMEHETARQKNIEGHREKTNNYFMLALQYMSKVVESMKCNHQVVMENPTEYEIKWGGKGEYKLTKRR